MSDAESIFTYGAPTLKFGDGASDELGYDLSQLGSTRALVITDPRVAATGLAERIAEQMGRFGVHATGLRRRARRTHRREPAGRRRLGA